MYHTLQAANRAVSMHITFCDIVTSHAETLENKPPSIDVRPTALAYPLTLTLTYDLHFPSFALRAMVITYTQGQGHKSVGSKDGVNTNGRTDGWRDGDNCITSCANAAYTNNTDNKVWK